MKITIEMDSVSELLDVSNLLSKLKKAHDVDVKAIRDLKLRVRTENCLKSAGISSIDELMKMSDNELLKIPNLGRMDLNGIREALQKIGVGEPGGES